MHIHYDFFPRSACSVSRASRSRTTQPLVMQTKKKYFNLNEGKVFERRAAHQYQHTQPLPVSHLQSFLPIAFFLSLHNRRFWGAQADFSESEREQRARTYFYHLHLLHCFYREGVAWRDETTGYLYLSRQTSSRHQLCNLIRGWHKNHTRKLKYGEECCWWLIELLSISCSFYSPKSKRLGTTFDI